MIRACHYKRLTCYISAWNKRKYMFILLLAIPASIIADFTCSNQLVSFFISCISIIPLAALVGDCTEKISVHIGSKLGGLLNATMGNMPELFIGIFSVKAGMFSLVKSGVVGSITGNMLLVLGISIFIGGIKYKFQSFDKFIARTNYGLLFLALIGFIIPSACMYLGASTETGINFLSFGTAVVLLIIYTLGLFFSLYTHKNIFVKSEDRETDADSKGSLRGPVLCLILAAALLAYESNLLVNSISFIKSSYNLSEKFLGIIIIPIIGNISEYSSAVIMAAKNKINLSIEIAIGSGMQMSLFAAPILVLISFALGTPMNYVFSLFELVTIVCSIGLSLYIFQDGKTNWLEGVELLSAYIIMALAYFFMID